MNSINFTGNLGQDAEQRNLPDGTAVLTMSVPCKSGFGDKATTTWLPWKKIDHAEDGLAMLDKALALLGPAHDHALERGVPLALETKLTAAGTFLALPSMFNRGERGRRLLDEVMKHPAYAGTPAAFQEAARKIAAKAAQ